MGQVKHVLGISGGKDSAALALYMNQLYPELDIEYYTSDTGKELDETYALIERLDILLKKPIVRLQGADGSDHAPFDHFLTRYGGYLPSANSRWCTKKLKLDPFEKFVGDTPVISYVGIRGDEEREGYISKKSNIQSIFPFRQNIWSEDVTAKALTNGNLANMLGFYEQLPLYHQSARFEELLNQPLSNTFTRPQKLKLLLDTDTKALNKIVFAYLKTTDYPLAKVDHFPLVENDEVLVLDDIFKLLEDSGVGVPAYYKKIEYEVNGKKGEYARSRSGCYFCFFQQKIEWIWLYEQHPEKFMLAQAYEKDGYTWNEDETLDDLIAPVRMQQIKEEAIKRAERLANKTRSHYLIDILDDADSEGCAACFI